MVGQAISTFFINSKLCFKARLSYRTSTMVNLLVDLLLIFINIYLWRAIYDNRVTINGFSESEMILYIILVRVLRMLYPFGVTKSYAEMVKSGNIAAMLLKPISVEGQTLSSAVGNSIYSILFCCLPSILLIPFWRLEDTISLSKMGLALFGALNAYIFVYLYEMIFGALSYYTKSTWGIELLKNTIMTLMAGELLPIAMYPRFLQMLVQNLPFGSIYNLPISLLIENEIENVSRNFIILLLSNIVMYAIYRLISARMILHITIQGG